MSSWFVALNTGFITFSLHNAIKLKLKRHGLRVQQDQDQDIIKTVSFCLEYLDQDKTKFPST